MRGANSFARNITGPTKKFDMAQGARSKEQIRSDERKRATSFWLTALCAFALARPGNESNQPNALARVRA